jgi:hypothetical protein
VIGSSLRSAARRGVAAIAVAGLAVIALVDPVGQRAFAALPAAAGAALQRPLPLVAAIGIVLLLAELRGRPRQHLVAESRAASLRLALLVPAAVAALAVLRAYSAPVWRAAGGAPSPSLADLLNAVLGPPPDALGGAIADPALPAALAFSAFGGWAAWLGARAAVLAARGASGWPAWLTLARDAAHGALLAGAVLLALHLRWQHLLSGPDLGLSLDAQSYYDEALDLGRTMAVRGQSRVALFLSGSTWFREPLYVFILQAWLALLGPGVLHAVFLSLAASVVWVFVTGIAIGALLGRAAGLGAAYLLAIDAIWIRNAVDGLREEVAGVLLVAAVALLWHPLSRRHALVALAPLSVAAAALTRADALPFGIVVLAWAAAAQRWGPVKTVAIAGLLVAVLAPVYVGYARSRGAAIPSATVIATANWREEFADRMGTPGFEWDRSVTPTEYLFAYHSVPQLTWYTARGVTRIYTREMFDSLYYALAGGSQRWLAGVGRFVGFEWRYLTPLTFCAGCLGLLLQRGRSRTHWLPVLLCLVGVLPPIGFIAGVPQDRLYQARYAYMAAPFASAVVAWALVALLAAGWRRAAARSWLPASLKVAV